MDFSGIFSRILPGSAKLNIDYDISIDGEKYSLVLDYKLNKSWWMESIIAMNKKLVHKIEITDDFHADARFYSLMLDRLKGTLKSIQNLVRTDKKNFQIVTFTIDDVHFKTEGDKINTEIKVSGICHE